MDFFETVAARRSIRRYQNRPVEKEKLSRILEAARLAPSADNRQEWRFVVVQKRDTIEKLGDAVYRQTFVTKAPVIIACCAARSEYPLKCGHPAYAIDIGIAGDHITLAAAALGLGTCWIGDFQEDRVREILNIPDSVRVVELLTLGYPDENPSPRPRKDLSEIIYYEKWS